MCILNINGIRANLKLFESVWFLQLLFYIIFLWFKLVSKSYDLIYDLIIYFGTFAFFHIYLVFIMCYLMYFPQIIINLFSRVTVGNLCVG